MSREKDLEVARNSLGVGQETFSSVSKQSNKDKKDNKLKITENKTENKTEDKTEDKQELRGSTMLDNFYNLDYCQTLAQLVKKSNSNQMAKFEEIFRFRFRIEPMLEKDSQLQSVLTRGNIPSKDWMLITQKHFNDF